VKYAVAITGWQRPTLFRGLLQSLAANDLQNWDIFIQIEPSELSADFRVAAENILRASSVSLAINDAHLGIRTNPYSLLTRVFNTGVDFVLYLEEDLQLARDATALAEWYVSHHRPEWMCLSLLSGGCGSAGFISYPAFSNILFTSKNFNSLGFALRREEWLRNVQPVWFEDDPDFRQSTGLPTVGWDWSVYRTLIGTAGLYSLQPAAARATHTGRLGGTHCRPEWHDFAFAGLHLADPPITKRNYDVLPTEMLPASLRRHAALWDSANSALKVIQRMSRKLEEQNASRAGGSRPRSSSCPLGQDAQMQVTISAYERAGGHCGNATSVWPLDKLMLQARRNLEPSHPLSGLHVMVVVAHQDDETLGAGGSFAECGRLTMVYVTDGAPDRKMSRERGFATRAAYARARIEEAKRALSLTSVETTFVCLDVRDQRAAFCMAELGFRLRKLFAEFAPDVILTHAFEGGHPDHDATVFAVHAAQRMLDKGIPIIEMTGYHNANGNPVYGSFMWSDDVQPVTIPLSAQARARKKAMLESFASQKDVISCFSLEAESFRIAPRYNFSKRPHDGELCYERNSFSMTWNLWLRLVRRATRSLERDSRGLNPLSWLRRAAVKVKSAHVLKFGCDGG